VNISDTKAGLHPFFLSAVRHAMSSHPSREQEERFASATELTNPVQQTILRWRHDKEVERTGAECMDLFFGTMTHYYIEKHGGGGDESEQRWSARIDGEVITGGTDAAKAVEDGSLWIADFKSTKAIQFVMEYQKGDTSKKDKWTEQLNIYAHLARLNGKKVSRLTIEALVRDWSQGMYYRDKHKGYPAENYVRVPITLWPMPKAEAWIRQRIDALRKANAKQDGQLPPCPQDELWGGKRCKLYCDVAKFCYQNRERGE
jgi:hypothetical protein